MTFFKNDRVDGEHKIDYVIDNFIYTSLDHVEAMGLVLRELCMLLGDSQQKELVESLCKNSHSDEYNIAPEFMKDY